MATRGEAWAEARRLVVAEGQTYAEAAQVVGLPLATLQKRAAAERWRDDRATASSTAAQWREIQARTRQAVLDALSQPEIDPGLVSQLIFAAEKAERAYCPQAKSAAVDPQQRRAAVLELLEGLVRWLGDRDPATLTALRPHLTPFAESIEAADAG